MTAPSKDYPMRRFICLMWVVAAFAAANGSRDVLAADIPQVNLTEWTPPDIKTVGDDALGKLIKYGYALMTDTANQIGPMVSDPAKRYSGNNLTCQNCHLKAGTQPYAMPLTGVWGQFPQYRGRDPVFDARHRGREARIGDIWPTTIKFAARDRCSAHLSKSRSQARPDPRWMLRPMPRSRPLRACTG